METSKLTALTLDELYSKKKTLTGTTIGFGFVMILASAVLIYLSFKSQKSGLLAIIPALLIILIPGLVNLNKINAEIKSRLA